MKLFLNLFVSTALLASPSFADQDALDANQYEVVGQRFEGIESSAQFTPGWYTGRCFFPNAPTTAKNTIVILETHNPAVGDPNDGPLFPVEPQATVKPMYLQTSDPSHPANYYDVLTDAKMNSISNYLPRARGIYTTPLLATNGTVSNSVRTDLFELRANPVDGYYYARWTNSYNPNQIVTMYCYYFKKVL